MSKILIVGNHCCSNRGDAAILRGLLDYLEVNYPDSHVDFSSRYINGARWFFNKEVLNDPLYEAKKNLTGLTGRVEKVLINKVIFPLYCAKKIKNKKILPKVYSEFAQKISEYDLVIQVGGSFFVDLYGASQFEAAAICINENIPIVMLGHSVGPFKLHNTKKIAKNIFTNCSGLILREKISEQHLHDAGLTDANYVNGADTAWLIDPEKYTDQTVRTDHKKMFNRPCIAITTRELSPFDKRLGITQDKYEQKLATLCLHLIQEGYNIVAASTCTGLDSYHRDDRMPALRVADLVKEPDHYFTIMDELTDVELGVLLGRCELTIGTRLHSAILSMRFGTPAFAIYYEHKSLGILEQMGMKEYSIDIHDIDSKTFKKTIETKLVNISDEVQILNERVSREAKNCEETMNKVLDVFLKTNSL